MSSLRKRHPETNGSVGSAKRLASQNIQQQDPNEHESDSSEGDENDVTSSQVVDSSSLTEKSCDMIRYMLTMKQKDCPILKADLIKNCLESQRSQFDTAFKRAVAQLKVIFGIQVHQVNVGANRPGFVLVNSLAPTCGDINQYPPCFFADTDRTPLDLGILYVVLAFIRLRHPETMLCPEQALLDFLQMISVSTEKNHNSFGDVKKLLYRDWVHKNYVRILKTTSTDGVTSSEIGWGERAQREVHLDNFLARFCELYGECTKEELQLLQEHEQSNQD